MKFRWRVEDISTQAGSEVAMKGSSDHNEE